ncbi:MAG: DUF4230 domain-containing protein [Bacteroidia bacterium]|nr:DUF4230 domain-containing protein [Bacteroidia bacterium]
MEKFKNEFMNNSKHLTYLLIVVIFIAGFFVAKSYYQPKADHSTEESVILIEQIKTVSKLITVEAYYNELYTYHEYYKFNWSPFQKKAIIRVRAKVSAGYDLGALQFETNEKTKTIYIRNMPKPSILSMDHDLDYYDINQGVFNKFNADDYNKMNHKAKQLIYQKAMESYLLVEAAKKGIDMIKSMQQMAKNVGWEVKMGR